MLCSANLYHLGWGKKFRYLSHDCGVSERYDLILNRLYCMIWLMSIELIPGTLRFQNLRLHPWPMHRCNGHRACRFRQCLAPRSWGTCSQHIWRPAWHRGTGIQQATPQHKTGVYKKNLSNPNQVKEFVKALPGGWITVYLLQLAYQRTKLPGFAHHGRKKFLQRFFGLAQCTEQDQRLKQTTSMPDTLRTKFQLVCGPACIWSKQDVQVLFGFLQLPLHCEHPIRQSWSQSKTADHPPPAGETGIKLLLG